MRYQKPDILVLLETRIGEKEADDVIRRTKFDYSFRVEAKGFSGRYLGALEGEFKDLYCSDFRSSRVVLLF